MQARSAITRSAIDYTRTLPVRFHRGLVAVLAAVFASGTVQATELSSIRPDGMHQEAGFGERVASATASPGASRGNTRTHWAPGTPTSTCRWADGACPTAARPEATGTCRAFVGQVYRELDGFVAPPASVLRESWPQLPLQVALTFRRAFSWLGAKPGSHWLMGSQDWVRLIAGIRSEPALAMGLQVPSRRDSRDCGRIGPIGPASNCAAGPGIRFRHTSPP